MAETLKQRWNSYRPTKRGLAWSFLAGIAATLVAGFWGLGWHTAGGAEAMARHAAVEARVKLASGICVTRFLQAPDAAAQLAVLQGKSESARDRFIEKGGWVSFARREVPIFAAAEPCAETLLKMKAAKSSAPKSSAPAQSDS